MRTLALLALCFALSPCSLLAKGKPKRPAPAAAPDAASVAALATANHFLHAWQTGDLETGIMLLTDGARRQSSEEKLRDYFAAPMPRAFEIHRGKKLGPTRYSFPMALLEATDARHIRCRNTQIIVINQGMNDWAIDKLP